ncbi:MAG: DUF2339 domain-containing protein [Myxococcota bacterium]|nr:DUF2339 domain-containing protein [Myxococcota bacterium]
MSPTHGADDRASDDPVTRLEQQLAALRDRVAQLELVKPPSTAAAERRAPMTEAADAVEAKLGTYWLSRLGIVSLITGTALLIITYFGELGPVIRVALGYAIAALLGWAGLRLARRHLLFGRVVFGGGLAIAYFVTYSLHFVPAMQIIESKSLGLVLVAAAITGIVITAHRMRSETVAGVALFLGLHTGMLTDVTALTLVCTTLLAAGAGFFLAANRWVIVPVSTVIAVYSTHATLALQTTEGALDPWLSIAFLGVDFALFATAVLIRVDVALRSLVALSVLNWVGVLVLGSHALQVVSDRALVGFLAVLASVQALVAALAWLREAPRTFVAVQSGIAIITMALALPVTMTGGVLVAGWSALALAAAGIARRADLPAFGGVALAILAVMQGHARLDDLGVAAQLGCVTAWFAAERLHARGDRGSSVRGFLVAGVALALMQLAMTAFPAGYQTATWVVIAFVLFAAGFALRSRTYRWAGFAVLGCAALRLFVVELRRLSDDQRIFTFVTAGALLLIVSFAYTRMRSHPTA